MGDEQHGKALHKQINGSCYDTALCRSGKDQGTAAGQAGRQASAQALHTAIID